MQNYSVKRKNLLKCEKSIWKIISNDKHIYTAKKKWIRQMHVYLTLRMFGLITKQEERFHSKIRDIWSWTQYFMCNNVSTSKIHF